MPIPFAKRLSRLLRNATEVHRVVSFSWSCQQSLPPMWMDDTKGSKWKGRGALERRHPVGGRSRSMILRTDRCGVGEEEKEKPREREGKVLPERRSEKRQTEPFSSLLFPSLLVVRLPSFLAAENVLFRSQEGE
mmetsp:Transcript_40625/g.80050  ORF Transcript_40625/g.80050 Transcript_40625/m.80050 type:complete len:134 (-) Transcript_40625:2148-2549(-)